MCIKNMCTEKEKERKNKYIEWKEDKKNLDENSIDILVHENKWNERKKNKDGQKNKFLIHKW